MKAEQSLRNADVLNERRETRVERRLSPDSGGTRDGPRTDGRPGAPERARRDSGERGKTLAGADYLWPDGGLHEGWRMEHVPAENTWLSWVIILLLFVAILLSLQVCETAFKGGGTMKAAQNVTLEK